MSPTLVCVTKNKHRNALSRFQCSSHFLEIEKARHKVKIPPNWERLCPHYKYAVDNELHLLLFCEINAILCHLLNIVYIPNLAALHHSDLFSLIMSS